LVSPCILVMPCFAFDLLCLRLDLGFDFSRRFYFD